jgi:outer membrane receptor for ferrienterochelin and colicin
MRERIMVAALAVMSFVFASFGGVSAQTPAVSTIQGRILETSAGLPVGGATVRLYSGSLVLRTTTTVSNGTFSFDDVAPGDYTLLISARGYQTVRSQPLRVSAGQALVEFQTAIAPSTAGLREIGVVSTVSRSTLSTSATINQNVNPGILQDQNYVRAGDVLATLPFVNASTSSSQGDDETIGLRGMDPTETATLLEGHPIGPIGALGSGFDYQLGQFWGFSSISVINGSGATGLYSVPTIAGAVNFDLINPTPQNHLTVTQGFGDNGKMMTGASFTGTANRFGYAMFYGVQGTNGELGPMPILQTGLLGGSQSTCPNSPTANAPVYTTGANPPPVPPSIFAGDEAACTYNVSGDYFNRNLGGKLTYDIDPKTSIFVSALDQTMWADSTGNGDTDYLTYPFVLQGAQGAIADGNNQITLPNGSTSNCSGSTLAVLMSFQTYTCMTPQQYASAFSGPAGGGIGRFHSAWMQDYHARLTRQIGPGNLVLDGFINNYHYLNVKGLASTGAPQHDDDFFTHGALIGYDYAGNENDASAGVYFQHQQHRSNFGSYNGPFSSYFLSDTVYFLKDTYAPNDRWSFFSDLGFDRSLNTATTNFDPRLSIVYRPTVNDVVRITGGRSTSEPDPSLLYGGYQFNDAVSSFNGFDYCSQQLLAPVGSGSTPTLQPEHANDIEAALAHRFGNQATLEADYYNTVETNPILGGTFPLSIVPAADRPSAAYLQPFLNKLNGECGTNFTASHLGVSTTFNAAKAYYRGLNVAGTVPFLETFTLDAHYTIQSAYYQDVDDNILINNPLIVNGAQISGVPLHSAGVGLAYNNRPAQFAARVDENYVGGNNSFHRPAYWYANANVSKGIGPLTFNLGVYNIFNNNASPWGYIGYGTYQPENQFGDGSTTGLEQGSEEFGLPARQIWFTTTVHL